MMFFNKFFTLLVALLVVGSAYSQTEFKINNPDPQVEDGFGFSVGIWKDKAVVGSYYDDNSNGADAGSAYAFQWNGTEWVESQFILPQDGATESSFGYSICLADTQLVIAATYDRGCGSVYYFTWNGEEWVEKQKIEHDNIGSLDDFGTSMALDGNTLLVSSPEKDDNGMNSGAVYVFKLENNLWVLKQTLYPNDPQPFDVFGYSVAIEGETIAVGTPAHSAWNPAKTGYVYTFNWDGTEYVETQKIIPFDGSLNDWFGRSVGISDNKLAVGASYSGEGGAVYLYNFDGTEWIYDEKLTSSEAGSGARFGDKLTFNGKVLAIGSPWHSHDGTYNVGSAYIYKYENNTYNYIAELVPSDLIESGWAGQAVAQYGSNIMVGAPYQYFGDMQWVGASYVYSFEDLLNDDATLSDLTVNGVSVDGFGSDVLEYNVLLPLGTTEVPTVVGTPNDLNASAFVMNATTLPGTTQIVVTAENGITQLTYIVNFTIATGVENLSFGRNITPNPANEIIQIRNMENSTLKIYSLTGKLMNTREITENNVSMDISFLPAGSYFFNFTNNENTVSIKVIVL